MRSSFLILSFLSLIFFAKCQVFEPSTASEGPETGVLVLINSGSKPLPEGTVLQIGEIRKLANKMPMVVFKDLTPGDHTLLVNASGFAPYQSLVTVPPGTINTVIVRLLPSISSDIEYDGTEIKLYDTSMDIKIPPGTFEGLKEGETLTLRRSHINVKSDMLHAMPGDFSATALDGNSVQLESFGAFELTALSGGRELQIKEGKSIQVLIPFQGEVKPGQTHATLWSFHEKSGKWKEEMEAPLVKRDGRYWVDARIPHLSYWNVDAPITDHAPIIVRRVRDKDGNTLHAPALLAEGVDYNGISLARSHQYGSDSICIQVKRNSRIQLTARTILDSGFQEASRVIQSKGPGTCANPTNAVYIDDLEIRPAQLGNYVPGLPNFPINERITLMSGRVYRGTIVAQLGTTIFVATRTGLIRIPRRNIAEVEFNVRADPGNAR